MVFPGANRRETYFSVHNVAAAHDVSRGKGVRVGLLDHSFGLDAHPDLYAGGEDFAGDAGIGSLRGESHHGYWMALTLRDIAPESEIFALNTATRDETDKVDAMIRAIDWAIENDLRVLAYSDRAFSDAERARLDAAVERAHAHKIITTFIHYPHPNNILPTGLYGRTGDDQREPDINILHYDYNVVFVGRYQDYAEIGAESGYVPFLSLSSTSVVTAGVVALMLATNDALTAEQCKRALMDSARSMTFEGKLAPRVMDARAALGKLGQP